MSSDNILPTDPESNSPSAKIIGDDDRDDHAVFLSMIGDQENDALGPTTKISQVFSSHSYAGQIFPWKDQVAENDWNGLQSPFSSFDVRSAAPIDTNRRKTGPISVIVTNARNLTDNVGDHPTHGLDAWHGGAMRADPFSSSYGATNGMA